MSDMHRPTLAFVLCALLGTAAAQSAPADRSDAVHLLQGTTADGRIDPAAIARVAEWLGRIREAHPAVARIHTRPDHELGAAMLTFEPEAQEQARKGTYRLESGRLMQQGELGIPALDALQQDIGARLQRSGIAGGDDIWIARFPSDLDVVGVCRRYAELKAVASAVPNGYRGFGGGSDIALRRRGDRLLFVFAKGRGEAAPARFLYYEVDAAAATITERGELPPDEVMVPRIHLWNVPERFPVGAFADLDAVLAACGHADWWVVRHGVEVLGHLLSGVGQPKYGEDLEHAERFAMVRDELRERRRAGFEALLAGLDHEDTAVRDAALRWMRHVSGLDRGADEAGRRAFRRWVDAELRR